MYIIAACLPACRPLFNMMIHPSRNMQNNHEQKDTQHSSDDNGRHIINDIELQRTGDSREESGNINGGRYHGFGEGFRGMQGRFKRLGSDAGLFLGKRDSSPHTHTHSSHSSHSSPSPSPPPNSQSPLNPSPPPRDPDQQFISQAEGRFGLGLHKLRSQSRELIFKQPVFKQPFRQPERVHIADMHVGHMQRDDGERDAVNGIRIKQEFQVYYDRPSLV